jgi:hypothetical protein
MGLSMNDLPEKVILILMFLALAVTSCGAYKEHMNDLHLWLTPGAFHFISEALNNN